MSTIHVRLPRLMSVEEVARLLDVCTKTVRRWICRGDIHVHRVGRNLRIAEEDLQTFLNRNRT
jgi:excisionase family DNA binding protein